LGRPEVKTMAGPIAVREVRPPPAQTPAPIRKARTENAPTEAEELRQPVAGARLDNGAPRPNAVADAYTDSLVAPGHAAPIATRPSLTTGAGAVAPAPRAASPQRMLGLRQ